LKKSKKMIRTDFIKMIIRILLFSLLVITVILLGKKTVSGGNCSGCPGNGICSGLSDCNKYQESYGKGKE